MSLKKSDYVKWNWDSFNRYSASVSVSSIDQSRNDGGGGGGGGGGRSWEQQSSLVCSNKQTLQAIALSLSLTGFDRQNLLNQSIVG